MISNSSFIIVLVAGLVHPETVPVASTSYAESEGASGSKLSKSAFHCYAMCSHISKSECIQTGVVEYSWVKIETDPFCLYSLIN